MRIIDAHTHLLSPERVPHGMRRAWARQAATRRLPERDPADILPRVAVGQSDPDGTLTRAALDFAGVESAVCPVIDWTLAPGVGSCDHGCDDLPIAAVNAATAAACASSEGRLFHCPSVDPRHADAREMVGEALDEPTARGLKLYPATGWRMDDPGHAWQYEVLREREMVALVHTAPTGGEPLITPYSRPSAVAPVLAGFPDLTLVMAHAGFEAWWLEALEISMGWPRTYLELSLWQPLAHRDYAEFRERIAILAAQLGAHRLIFGSDTLRGPATDPAGELLKRWIDQFVALSEPYDGRAAVLSAEQLALVLGENAARVYRL